MGRAPSRGRSLLEGGSRGGSHRGWESRYAWAAPLTMPAYGGRAEGAAGRAAPPAGPPGRVSRRCGTKLPQLLPARPAGAHLPGAQPPAALPSHRWLIPRRPVEALPAPLGGQGQATAAPPAPRSALGPGGLRPPAAGVRGPGGEPGGGRGPRRPTPAPLPFPAAGCARRRRRSRAAWRGSPAPARAGGCGRGGATPWGSCSSAARPTRPC